MDSDQLKKHISQRDIAKLLGVNVSTVSRALNGLGGVSAALRKEIGSEAFKLLQDQINGDDQVRQVVVNARLVVRESTRKV